MYKSYNSLVVSNSTIFQQIKSFNLFLKTYLIEILIKHKFLFFLLNKISIIVFSIQKFYITFPVYFEKFDITPITPQVCRVINETYSSLLLVTISSHIKMKNVRRKKKRIFSLGRIPIILRSNRCYLKYCKVFKMLVYGECPFELGGYFLIKGYEKAILFQEQMRDSLSNLYHLKKNTLFLKIPNFLVANYKNFFLIIKNNYVFIRSKFFNTDIDFFLFLVFLGFKNLGMLLDYINTRVNKKITFYKIYTLKKKNIWKKKSNIFIQEIIKKKYFSLKLLTKIFSFKEFVEILILPKIIPFKNDFSIKVMYIIILLFKSLRNFHFENNLKIKYNVQNIRYFLIGNILKAELSFLFNKLIKNFIDLLKKKITSINEYSLLFDSSGISTGIITNGLEYSLKSGIFSNNFFNKPSYLSSQLLSRLSFLSTLSLLTKITSFINKKRKVLVPRLVFSSNWCKICPFETPEGESCGLIKNFSIFVSLSDTILGKALIYLLIITGLKKKTLCLISKNVLKKTTYVFVNSILIGFHENFLYLYYSLKYIRKFLFNSLTFNIYIELFLVGINCDAGRLLRPLLTKEHYDKNYVTTKKKMVRFKKKLMNYFINNGTIEFLDIEEEYINIIEPDESLINNQTSYLEIDPYCLFGFCLSAVPFIKHNQSPRNTYHCSMEKQSIGSDVINKLILGKNTIESLWFPQRAIITTTISNLYGIDLLGSAQNIIISMIGYGTYDIEDALMLSNCSKDLGLFRSSVKKSINFTKFPKLIKKAFNFSFNINEKHNEINIAKYNYLSNERKTKKMMSRNYTSLGFLKRYGNLGRNKFLKAIFSSIKVTLVTALLNGITLFDNMHTIEIGDKFASRHGQKGILGNLIRKEDLPFNLSGNIPDLMMNPHGIPSRMTIGQILEIITSKALICKGITSVEKNKDYFYDYFLTINDVGCFLNNKNQNCYGKETLICGIESNLINTNIYLGPMFYQKLNHLAANKIFTRGYGKKNTLTKQPSKGKKNEGGLKIGEMEKDCITAYGCSIILIERMLRNSDAFKVKINKLNGCITQNKNYCNHTILMHYLKIPYSFELLTKELEAACISIKVKIC